MTDNIFELECSKDEGKGLLEQMIRNLPLILEYSKIKAEISRSDYLAYIDQGFTEEQSLDLCRSTF